MTRKATFLDRIIQNRILSHILFWGGFFMIFTILAALNSGDLEESLISYLGFLPSQLLAGYLLVYYQVPKLLLKRKYLRFFISFTFSIYLFSVLARLSSIYIAEPFFRKNFYQEGILEVMADPLFLAIVYFPTVYVFVFLMLVIKVIKDRFQEKHQMEIVQKEKANTELKFLKAQIHPHFLFNTLNNLYSLTLVKSDAAPEVVLKLSDMLDYILYQCNEPKVLLTKEIDLLQDYIDLESLRYGDKLELKFIHTSDDPTSMIAPLVLLSFVENAFKHGTSGNPSNPKISIDLKVKDNQLTFKVFNTKLKSGSAVDFNGKRSGIGFNNAERQLELNYKDNYELNIRETEDDYEAVLNIDLR